MKDVEQLLEGKSICICAGSGGVGKTTTSAAIAAGMAARGKRVAVLTIDPAKRLADSLGLQELGNVERQVDPALFSEAGVDPGGGELWAMMLDAKATFDEVVRQALRGRGDAGTGSSRTGSIARSRMRSPAHRSTWRWRSCSRSTRRSATTCSCSTRRRRRNALDFLDAPRRLTQFIEGRSLQLFIRPSGFGMRVLGRGTSVMFSVLKRVTGMDLIEDLSEFFTAMSGMVAGFRERAQRVNELLADDQTSFLVVCGPAGEPINEAVYFHRKLVEAKLPFGGVIVNKVHAEGRGSDVDEGLTDSIAELLGDADLARRVSSNFDDYRSLAARDARNIARLARELRSSTVIEVPYLTDDVHDLAGLFEIDSYLFADQQPA